MGTILVLNFLSRTDEIIISQIRLKFSAIFLQITRKSMHHRLVFSFKIYTSYGRISSFLIRTAVPLERYKFN